MSESNTEILEDRIKTALDEVRPFLQADGGDLEFVALNGKVVQVRLRGACAGCPGAQMTLRMGVERHLKEKCPEVESVEAVQ